MKHLSFVLFASLLCSAILSGADPTPASITRIFDGQIKMVEGEVVSLAEAMPEDKYGFVPPGETFAKSRTFLQQVTHIATTNYMCAAALLGEKNPIEVGPTENGPASITTKAAAVKFLKDSFAYTHKAAATVTDQNLNEQIQSPFGKNKTARVSVVTIPTWHTFDHYGQMVIYARLNGIVPPASR